VIGSARHADRLLGIDMDGVERSAGEQPAGHEHLVDRLEVAVEQ
jgi:hypothetical protein